jgi:anti-sigma28 factor (negative regulator of flagellin synthesis)
VAQGSRDRADFLIVPITSNVPPAEFRRPDDPNRSRRRDRVRREIEGGTYRVDLERLASHIRARGLV